MNLLFLIFSCLGTAVLCLSTSSSSKGGKNSVDASVNVQNDSVNVQADVNVELPCDLNALDPSSLSIDKLTSSTIECLCNLKNAVEESGAYKSFMNFIKVSGVSPVSLPCGQTETKGADVAPPVAEYDTAIYMTYSQKYDIESYLTSNKYVWNDEDLKVTFIDGISESNQPKFGTASLNTKVEEEVWTVTDFTDMSFCQKYPENSLYFNLQKLIHQLIFGDKDGCAVESGTEVTVEYYREIVISVSEKFPCGSNTINIVLQTPDGENAVGFYWRFSIPKGPDCIDYSSEETREKAGVKKLGIPYTFEKITRSSIMNYEKKDPYLLTEKNKDDDEPTYFAFPRGFDTESIPVFTKKCKWQAPRFEEWNMEYTILSKPCDIMPEFSKEDMFVRFFKHVVFGGQDCPIEKGTNITIPVEYPDLELRSNVLLECGNHEITIWLNYEGYKFDVIRMEANFFITNTTECIDYSTW